MEVYLHAARKVTVENMKRAKAKPTVGYEGPDVDIPYPRDYWLDPSSGGEEQAVGQKIEFENEDGREIGTSKAISVPRLNDVQEPVPVILAKRCEEWLSEKGKENEEKAKHRGEEEAERERERERETARKNE